MDSYPTRSNTRHIKKTFPIIHKSIDGSNNNRGWVCSDFLKMHTLSLGPTWPNIFPIVHVSDKFSNREQYETDRNDENAMCDYLSEYLRMCFRLYEDSARPFLNFLRTFANEVRQMRINKTK